MLVPDIRVVPPPSFKERMPTEFRLQPLPSLVTFSCPLLEQKR